MAVSRATTLCALTLAALCGTASAGLLALPLPLLSVLPGNCGAVYKVQSGDTCQKIADWAGISLNQYVGLNPLALCGLLIPTPGALVCSGDKLAFCSQRYSTVAGDTCSSITSLLGTILSLGSATSCGSLVPNTEVCVAPAANPCAVDTLCGVPLSSDLQTLLGTAPDYCTIARECKAPLTLGTTGGLPSLTMSLTSVTPAVQSVVGNDGHPELRDFASLPSGSQMDVVFVPGAMSDGSSAVSFATTVGGTRKLLGTATKGGTARYPRGNYGYGRR